MATHSNILAQEMPWTEEAGGPPSMGHERVRQDLTTEQPWQLLCSTGNSTQHPMMTKSGGNPKEKGYMYMYG